VLVDELALALKNRRQPVTVVIDAPDEAVEPERVIRDVIQPLVDSTSEVGIRLVLGLSRQLLDVPGRPWSASDNADYFERAYLVEYAPPRQQRGRWPAYHPGTVKIGLRS